MEGGAKLKFVLDVTDTNITFKIQRKIKLKVA